jgi:hypothetical protein
MPCKPMHLTTRTHFFLLCSRWGSGRTFRMPSFPIFPRFCASYHCRSCLVAFASTGGIFSAYVCLPNVVMTISLRSSQHCADPVLLKFFSPHMGSRSRALGVGISEIQTFPATACHALTALFRPEHLCGQSESNTVGAAVRKTWRAWHPATYYFTGTDAPHFNYVNPSCVIQKLLSRSVN